jgi:hypothetical protein
MVSHGRRIVKNELVRMRKIAVLTYLKTMLSHQILKGLTKVTRDQSEQLFFEPKINSGIY